MALTETQENDKIEVVNKWNIQVRRATVIKKDGVELTRSFNWKTITPGDFKGGEGSDNDDWIETDISGEDADVQAICNAAWTTQVKADYKTFVTSTRTS